MKKPLPCLLTLGAFFASINALPGVAQLSFDNTKVYRQTGERDLQFQRGYLEFFLFDGTFVRECGFSGDPQAGDLPLRPGAIPCPAGDNALYTRRFGERDRDIVTLWTRISSVSEATQVPPRLPGYIELSAGPLTALPRPLRDFRDRSVLILHDLQTASFREKDVTIYRMTRAYEPGDVDTNGDGVLTDEEFEAFRLASNAADVTQLRETMLTASSNGYLVTYPNRGWVNANRDLDPEIAIRSQSAVNQLQIPEAWPGPSARSGLTNVKTGFYFTNLTNFGLDYDGEPSLIMDPRSPQRISWTGIDGTNAISNLDRLYIRVFEKRYQTDGTPIPYNGGTGTVGYDVDGVTPANLDTNTGVILDMTVNALGQAALNELILLDQADVALTLFVEDSERIRIFNTGFAELDGKSFYVRQRTVPSYDPVTATISITHRIELFNDESLLEPFVLDLTGTATGTGAVISDEADLEWPIWPFAFVEQNFGGQLQLPNVYDKGYQLPDFALSLPIGGGINGFSPLTNVELVDPDTGERIRRNDLIFRLRLSRNVLTANDLGQQALAAGDQSTRDFEIQLVLTDTFAGALTTINSLLSPSSKSDGTKDKADDPEGGSGDLFAVDADYDGDGRTNFYEFAFDTEGTLSEEVSSMFDASRKVNAKFDVSVDGESKLCTLKIGKRSGVRNSVLYSFDMVDAETGSTVKIDADSEGWEVVRDDQFYLVLRSTAPLGDKALFRASAEENPYEPILAE